MLQPLSHFNWCNSQKLHDVFLPLHKRQSNLDERYEWFDKDSHHCFCLFFFSILQEIKAFKATKFHYTVFKTPDEYEYLRKCMQFIDRQESI